MRRELYDRYGEKKLYEGGLSVRTTLDPKLQVLARKALIDGLVQVRRGATAVAGRSPRSTSAGDWGAKLAEVKALSDVAPWRLAVVLESRRPVGAHRLAAGREPGGALSKERDVGIVPLDGVKWAKVKGRRAGRARSTRCSSPAT